MNEDFHDKPFDETTQDKLSIIRGYIREWIPVFLTKPKKNRYYENVAIFDFFSGPGTDSKGNPGSPLIIIEEIDNYLKKHIDQFNTNVNVFLFFNDSNSNKVRILEQNIQKWNCPTSPYKINISNQSFISCYNYYHDFIHSPDTACLLLVDQFGVKEITPGILSDIQSAPATDLIFFYASHFIKRFGSMEIGQKYLIIDPDKIQNTPENQIHLLVCNSFRDLTNSSISYYLAPFSLKKNTNVYGLIFGSHSLFGLEKFLTVSWNVDPLNGEANMDIYDDRPETQSLFEEYNIPVKKRTFERDLLVFLQKERTNNELYEFTLLHGFLGMHCRELLKKFNKNSKLEIIPLLENVKKNTFYISWDSYNKQPKIKVKIKQYSNG